MVPRAAPQLLPADSEQREGGVGGGGVAAGPVGTGPLCVFSREGPARPGAGLPPSPALFCGIPGLSSLPFKADPADDGCVSPACSCGLYPQSQSSTLLTLRRLAVSSSVCHGLTGLKAGKMPFISVSKHLSIKMLYIQEMLNEHMSDSATS